MPDRVTAYYDPILDIHQRLPTTMAMTYCFYLAPQVPTEARRLFAAAAASAGISETAITNIGSPRINAIAWFLSREWGMDALEARLSEALETHYEPTWDRKSGEFSWGLGLGEAHPRGQYNAFLAAAEAVSPGAWTALSAAPMAEQPGLVEGVDFPTLALAQASWEGGVLRLRLHPQNAEVEGSPTRFKITGLQDPARWRIEGDATATAGDRDVVIETTIREHGIALIPT